MTEDEELRRLLEELEARLRGRSTGGPTAAELAEGARAFDAACNAPPAPADRITGLSEGLARALFPEGWPAALAHARDTSLPVGERLAAFRSILHSLAQAVDPQGYYGPPDAGRPLTFQEVGLADVQAQTEEPMPAPPQEAQRPLNPFAPNGWPNRRKRVA